MRQRPGILPVVRQFVSDRMPQHVRMHRKGQLGHYPRPPRHPQEPSHCDRRPGLGHEHVQACPLEWPQGPQLRAVQGVHARDPALGPVYMQPAVPEIDLGPARLAELSGAEPMPIGQQDRGSVPRAIASTFASRLDQLLDFGVS